jgi:glycerol uptake facilitator-like aquaporin
MYGRFALGCNIATVILGMVILACGVIGIGLSVTFTLLIAGSVSSAIPPTIPVAYPVTPSFPHND